MADVDHEIDRLLAHEAQERARILAPDVPSFAPMWQATSRKVLAHWERPMWRRAQFMVPLAIGSIATVVSLWPMFESRHPSASSIDYAGFGVPVAMRLPVPGVSPPEAPDAPAATHGAQADAVNDAPLSVELFAAADLVGPTDFLLDDEDLWLAEPMSRDLE